MTFISILQWIIIGGVAGYVSSLLLKAERQGCLIKIIIGIAGAFIGGFMMNMLFPPPQPGQLGGITGIGFVDSIINATVGAVILLIILEIILPGKQLGVDDGSKRSRRRR
ncbi:MAG: GlsB/YeaQ/YmgE family stress response membrane protein [Anaerolineae bacterium]|nr:GlsB/YeaQ/YmgE family stress response membrane protein [Anaerolineae bacterium]